MSRPPERAEHRRELEGLRISGAGEQAESPLGLQWCLARSRLHAEMQVAAPSWEQTALECDGDGARHTMQEMSCSELNSDTSDSREDGSPSEPWLAATTSNSLENAMESNIIGVLHAEEYSRNSSEHSKVDTSPNSETGETRAEKDAFFGSAGIQTEAMDPSNASEGGAKSGAEDRARAVFTGRPQETEILGTPMSQRLFELAQSEWELSHTESEDEDEQQLLDVHVR